ncbi:hypothetical protein A9Q99_11510 [Gammaproteobacteria bacterium 45_16_T64]|nr:hypothetical protein A9Q99_11510 [Gammaproteobacteria bacterium 45_16_T64]
MKTPVFLIIQATANPEEGDARQYYLENAGPITAGHGAVTVATYALTESLGSDVAPEVCVVVSFPSRESVDSAFSDPDYQRLVSYRDKGFSSIQYFVGTEQIQS